MENARVLIFILYLALSAIQKKYLDKTLIVKFITIDFKFTSEH